MSQVARAIAQIEAAEKRVKLPTLAAKADIPYTTLVDWKAQNWRPKAIASFERLVEVAGAIAPTEDEAGA